VHLSRTEGADLGRIKKVIQETRAAADVAGCKMVIGFGPTLLKDLAPQDFPADFQPYTTIKSVDGSGKEAKGTQEEMLLWITDNKKDKVWKLQYDARQALKGDMKVARETMTFMTPSMKWDDMTGFIDGTGNPEVARDREVAIVPDGQKGAGGAFIIAQRWVHNLEAWNKMPVKEQEDVFGRTKLDSTRLDKQQPFSHLSHVELRVGGTKHTADASKPKRDEMSRRSTPYAFHDGTVGLYFMAFCKTQAPLRERINAMYGTNGQIRDKLTDFSNPASGSYYFATSVETLNAMK